MLRSAVLSTAFLGLVLVVLSWPIPTIEPTPGLDQSWVAGLYMATERGLDAGTDVVFTYGPLGFLGLPNVYVVWLGRIAFFWTILYQVAFCVALLWAARRAFGLPVGFVLALFAVSAITSDPVLLGATVLCAAALCGDWSLRSRTAFALGLGFVSGIELLGNLRLGPTLPVMALATLIGLPDRRRTFPAFFAAMVLTFGLAWVVTGQAFSNLPEYAVNALSEVSGYSAAMVVFGPGPWWMHPVLIAGLVVIGVLCFAAMRDLDRMARVGLVLMVATVSFLMYKHAVVREGPDRIAAFAGVALAIGIALAPHVRRAVAIPAIMLLVACTWIADGEYRDHTLDFGGRAHQFRSQLETMALPGRAEHLQRLGREWLQAEYDVSPDELALIRGRTVHVAPWEANVAWAYDLNWDPLPIFQQYSAYTSRLDRLNAAKLESSSAPEAILWQNNSGPGLGNSPGAIDNRWPAFESPAQMVAMFCRYRVVRWNDRWAVLRHAPNRCGRERPVSTTVVGNAGGVRLPVTEPGTALLVRVEGLGVSGVERLRTLLFRAARRSVVLDGQPWAMVGETAGDGLLLRAPRWADYPGPFRLGKVRDDVVFVREPGFLTGVDASTKFTFRFFALPLDAPAIAPRAASQKRREQR
jgi:hypothetical protein